MAVAREWLSSQNKGAQLNYVCLPAGARLEHVLDLTWSGPDHATSTCCGVDSLGFAHFHSMVSWCSPCRLGLNTRVSPATVAQTRPRGVPSCVGWPTLHRMIVVLLRILLQLARRQRRSAQGRLRPLPYPHRRRSRPAPQPLCRSRRPCMEIRCYQRVVAPPLPVFLPVRATTTRRAGRVTCSLWGVQPVNVTRCAKFGIHYCTNSPFSGVGEPGTGYNASNSDNSLACVCDEEA